MERVDIGELEGVAGGAATPEEDVNGSELQARLASAIAALPARGRMVFGFVFADRLSPAETAAAMGVNRQVVFNWVFRIRQAARAALSET